MAALRAAIADGADVNAMEEDDAWGMESPWPRNPLLYALNGGEKAEECVRLLLAAGAHPMSDTGGLWTPLHEAVHEEYPLSLVLALLEAGADPNAKGIQGQTVLTCVMAEDCPLTYLNHIKLLLEFGADPNIADGYGCSACHYAEDCVLLALLLDYGADPRLRDRDGLAPFQRFQDMYDGAHHNLESLSVLYKNWTPHGLLPPWTPDSSAFQSYCAYCPGFEAGIKTLLLVLKRYHICRYIAGYIVSFVAFGHKEEMWWPLSEFSMTNYMHWQEPPEKIEPFESSSSSSSEEVW